MFKIGDRLQFIEREETKIIVTDNSKKNHVTFRYISGDMHANNGRRYSIPNKYIEYDYNYYRLKKLEKIIKKLNYEKCLENELEK